MNLSTETQSETQPDEGAETQPDGVKTQPDEGVKTQPDEGAETQPDEGAETQPDEGAETQPDEGANAPSELQVSETIIMEEQEGSYNFHFSQSLDAHAQQQIGIEEMHTPEAQIPSEMLQCKHGTCFLEGQEVEGLQLDEEGGETQGNPSIPIESCSLSELTNNAQKQLSDMRITLQRMLNHPDMKDDGEIFTLLNILRKFKV